MISRPNCIVSLNKDVINVKLFTLSNDLLVYLSLCKVPYHHVLSSYPLPLRYDLGCQRRG